MTPQPNRWIALLGGFLQLIGVLALAAVAALVGWVFWAKPQIHLKERPWTKPWLVSDRDPLPPKLSDWHKQARVRFLLVHGMGHHPLGNDASGPLDEQEGQPHLAGLANYHGLADALGFWNADAQNQWTTANPSNKPFWEREATRRELEYYKANPPDYETTRNRIVSLAAESNFRDFIRSYCDKAGYAIPPQIDPLNPHPALTPVDLHAADPSATQLPFKVLERNDKAVGFLFKLSAQPKLPGNLPADFFVVCWNLGACTVKERTYGSWDNLRVEADGNRLHGGTRQGWTSDFDQFIDQHRDSLNRWAKVRFVNWGFTDAAIYTQPYGFIFEWAIAEAFVEVAAEMQPQENTKGVLVTESLGSTVALNTVTRMLSNVAQLPAGNSSLEPYRVWLRHAAFPADSAPSRNAKLANLKKLRDWLTGEQGNDVKVAVYMFANQFGLIQACAEQNDRIRIPAVTSTLEQMFGGPAADLGADVKWPDGTGVNSQAFLEFAKKCMAARSRESHPENVAQGSDVQSKTFERLSDLVGRRFHIVSFHDPNDLLGFPLPRNESDAKSLTITNIYVDNSGPRAGLQSSVNSKVEERFDWLNVGIRGITDPNQAHRGFRRNPEVLDVMLNGLAPREAKPAP